MPSASRPLTRWPLLCGCGALLLALAACSRPEPYGVGPTVPVKGQILVAGKPLRLPANAFARVWFHPDSAKGNSCPQVPAADLQPDGSFALATRDAPGAPPGWYKVMLVATTHVDPNNPSRRRPAFVAARYGSPDTSGLAVRVVAEPAPGAYDLRLKP